MTEALDGQVSLFDLGIWSGKMFPERSAATSRTDSETSEPCWKKLYASQNRDFLFLDCRTSRSGRKPEECSATDGASHGERTTHNTGEFPSADGVSAWWSILTDPLQGISSLNVSEESKIPMPTKLSQILEENPDPKYNLTPKACAGILRRAERRGKKLPEALKTVLLMQSASVGGCDGGGKGALVQTEKSGTLGTGNDQTIFCLQGNGIDRADTAGCNGKGWKEDINYTLNTIDRPAVMAFAQNQRDEVRDLHGVAGALAAEPGMKQQTYIFDMTHANDVIRESRDVSLSLQARIGIGGNQGHCTFSMQGFGDYREGDVASSCKQRDFKDGTDLVCAVDCRNFREGGEINGTLQAKSNGGISYNLQNTVRTGMVVRRLTPLECTRLQGYPDGWVGIGDWTDEKGRVHKEADAPKYKALGNSIALPFWRWMFGRMAAYLPEGATLGSLFDGIGGFPLCWESIHGKGTAVWASEIEPFAIAVTKHHFGGNSDDR